MRRIATAQPMLVEMVASEKVKVAGRVYDIASGKVNLVFV
jgi:hypothetical protein